MERREMLEKRGGKRADTTITLLDSSVLTISPQKSDKISPKARFRHFPPRRPPISQMRRRFRSKFHRARHLRKKIKKPQLSPDHGGEGSEEYFLAGERQPHFVVESELLLRSPEKALELRVSQEGDRNDVAAPILADVDGEVSFRDVDGEAILVVIVLLPQAGAPPQDLLQARCLGELVGFFDRHFWGKKVRN